jgi:hypothetical protein
MENPKDPKLNRDEELQAENDLLKIKLSIEHGMKEMGDSGNLSPEVENQWLKQVYAFEQQYRDAKTIKLYDYLGRPEFLKWDALAPEAISKELERIRSIMAANNVEVDCICTYDDSVIYKFITEELFLHEMDDMRLPGMVCHYTYEEFHPNHDYDLREHVSGFLGSIFEKLWKEEYDQLVLAPSVTFSGKSHNRDDISGIIQTFQEAHDIPAIMSLDITEVVIKPEITEAEVRGFLLASTNRQGEDVRYDGSCWLHFVHTDGYWEIDAFDIPGIGQG